MKKYNDEILTTIKDHTEDDNGFSYQEQIEFTQELMEEFFEMQVSLEEAEIIYNQAILS